MCLRATVLVDPVADPRDQRRLDRLRIHAQPADLDGRRFVDNLGLNALVEHDLTVDVGQRDLCVGGWV